MSEIPKKWQLAVEMMRKSFDGTKVEFVDTELRRTKPMEHYPAGMLGCTVSVFGINLFLNATLVDDMLTYGQHIADDVVAKTIISSEEYKNKILKA